MKEFLFTELWSLNIRRKLKIHMKNDIPNISSPLQVAQIYYNMNFIASSSRFPWHFESNFNDCFWRTIFYSTQKMHVSECVCKTCLKELGIFLKCQVTLQSIFASCNFSQNGGLPQVFFKVSGIYDALRNLVAGWCLQLY